MRYDLKAETSRQGHRWASRGWVRKALNLIDQTPRGLVQASASLLGIGLYLLLRWLWR